MVLNLKKSPRAPSVSLEDALERTTRIYEKDRLHEAPTEVVAQNIGYKNANSGSALSAIASLRYFGLLVRPRNGFLAVTKEFESLRYAPTESQRQELLIGFLTTPPLYQELLQKYEAGLPSDATLKYELIQRGFIPAAAETALSAFKESVLFTGFFDRPRAVAADVALEDENNFDRQLEEHLAHVPPKIPALTHVLAPEAPAEDHDRIPVRLPGGRRAWLLIPTPFYRADKLRLKAQIDLLLAEDEEDETVEQ